MDHQSKLINPDKEQRIDSNDDLSLNKFQQRLKDKNEVKFIEANDYGIFLSSGSRLFRVSLVIDQLVTTKEFFEKEVKKFLLNLKMDQQTQLKMSEYLLPETTEPNVDYEFYVLEIEDQERLVLDKVKQMIIRDEKWKISYSDLKSSLSTNNRYDLDLIHSAFMRTKEQFLNRNKLNISFKCSLLSKEGINLLFYGFEKLSPFKDLSISFNKSKFQDDVFSTLGAQIGKQTYLNSLMIYLCTNQLQGEDMKWISQGLEQLQNLKSLQFDLWGNAIKNDGLFYILDGISNLRRLIYLTLKLHWQSDIDDQGANLFIQYLPKFTNLTFLNLNLYGNQITDEGCISIAKGLRFMPDLNILWLYLVDNQIVDIKGVQYLKRSIQKMKRLCFYQLDY